MIDKTAVIVTVLE